MEKVLINLKVKGILPKTQPTTISRIKLASHKESGKSIVNKWSELSTLENICLVYLFTIAMYFNF